MQKSTVTRELETSTKMRKNEKNHFGCNGLESGEQMHSRNY